MGRVAPPGDRATVTDQLEGLEVVVPARKNWFIIIFMGFWLCGWFAGESFAIYSVTSGTANDGRVFTLIWLVGWTVGGAFAVLIWLWNIAGRERLRFAPDAVRVRREVIGIGFGKEYDLAHVSRLRVSGEPMNMFQIRGSLSFWGLGGGLIAFDYGSSTIRIGNGLEEAEAQRIVDRIAGRFSRLR